MPPQIKDETLLHISQELANIVTRETLASREIGHPLFREALSCVHAAQSAFTRTKTGLSPSLSRP
jgi:hypothetical protein